jgi:hypothetical protein
MTVVRSAVFAIVQHAAEGMARVGRRLTLVARSIAYAAPLLLLLHGPALAEETTPKKVGTERIVVDPRPGAAEEPIHGPTGAAVPAKPAAKADGPRPEFHTSAEAPPPPVAAMRRRLLDAAYSGDLDRLSKVIQSNEMPPIFSIHEIGDPLDYLRSQSGDGKGLELLAILTDVLESSWARINPGTPQEMYVWPSFAALPLDGLPPNRLVELYKIVTSSDLEEMKNVGRYTFYNVGIGPDGTWHWFKLAD